MKNLKKKTGTIILVAAVAGSILVPKAALAATDSTKTNMKERPSIQQADNQSGEKPELPNGLEINDGNFIPDEDDDGTKYAKPEGENENGERPELPEGMEMNDGSFVPDEDDDGTKYPKPEGETGEGERPELPDIELEDGERPELPEDANGDQDQGFFQRLQNLPQDFRNWLKGFFGGNK